jgi:hypothetical protein
MTEDIGSSTQLPDARIVVTVATQEHDLQSGVEQLNPILQEILAARTASLSVQPWGRNTFGRLTFSQIP